MKFPFFILLAFTAFAGCSSTYYVVPDSAGKESDIRTVSEVDTALVGKTVSILLDDSTEFTSECVRIGVDSTTFIERSTGTRHHVSNNNVRRILHINRVEGALGGMLEGAAMGTFFLGGLRVTSPTTGALIGGGVGTALGAIEGNTTEFVFSEPGRKWRDSREAARTDSAASAAPAAPFYPSDHEYFISPSSRTVPEGRVSVSSLEVVLENIAVGVTPSTQVSLYSAIPVAEYVGQTVVFNVKQALWNAPKTGGAVFLYHHFYTRSLWAGGVVSYGRRSTISMGGVYAIARGDHDSNSGTVFIATKLETSRHTGFVFDAVLPTAIIGFRVFGERASVQLGIGFPLWDTSKNPEHHDVFTILPVLRIDALL